MRRVQAISLAVLVIAIALTAFKSLPTPAAADDFRMETDVFSGTQVDPIVETLTIFRSQVIYDFMGPNGEEITIFDIPRGSITLVDKQREMQTSISTSQLMAFMTTVKSQPQASTKGSLLLSPQFKEQYEAAKQVLTLADERLTYRARGIRPKHPEFVERFQFFAYWYARLNATRFGNPPPFGRIKLNQSLAQHGLIPAEIERTVVLNATDNDTQKMRSRHLTNWQLTDTDRKRIEQAKHCLKTYPEVPPERYWQISQASTSAGK